jgi:probable HAF family extracellular repeat protein
MKNLSLYIKTLGLIAAFAIPSHMSAQQPHYKLIDMGTFGGPHAFINTGNNGNNAVGILNNRGAVVGWANTTAPDPFPSFCFDDDCIVSHAFRWHNGVLTDLGALDSSLSSQAVWISQSGLIAGTSQNGATDPLVAGFPELRAVLWKNGHIIDLGTLPEGGFESSANAVNSKGQVIGWATNTIPDENSLIAPDFAPTQTRAFLWQNGVMRDLGALGGTDAIAEFINERGEVVGWSYTGATQAIPGCIFVLATHSFVWDENNGIRDLGTLTPGGTCTNATAINEKGVIVGDNVDEQSGERAFIWKQGTIQDLGGSLGGQETGAAGINDAGQVAGFATLAGEVLFHAVLWQGVGEITDLGVLGADQCSFATGINSKTQVVGGSAVGCVFDSQSHAVLWENGSIFDLNSLIAPGASLTLELAQGINDRGEIAGIGVDAKGNEHAYLLVPCDNDSKSDCQEVFTGAPATLFSTLVSPKQATSTPRSPWMPHRLPGPLRQTRAQ